MCQELEAYHQQRQAVFYPKADLPLPDALLRPSAPAPEVAAAQLQAAGDVCRRVLGQSPVEVRALSEPGTFHTLYRVVLSGGRRRIVRFNALSARQRDFPLLLDSAVMAHLRTAGLPGLVVDHVDLSRRWCPWDYEILEEAPGTSLKAFDHDDALIVPLLGVLGGVVARLHAIRTEGFGLLDVRPLAQGRPATDRLRGTWASWSDYLMVCLPEHVSCCVDLGAITTRETDTILKRFDTFQEACTPIAPCLLHGDLGNHNLFTDGTAITALIDWEDSLSGDPVFDIAFWATFHPERRHRAFLDGYRAVRPLPEDFEVRFWLYFLRVALAKTVLRHRLGLKDVPGRPPASLRIRKGLDQVEALRQAA
jgi:Ser/Thr protein kinase RdoA (MazF antagonist)